MSVKTLFRNSIFVACAIFSMSVYAQMDCVHCDCKMSKVWADAPGAATDCLIYTIPQAYSAWALTCDTPPLTTSPMTIKEWEGDCVGDCPEIGAGIAMRTAGAPVIKTEPIFVPYKYCDPENSEDPL